jgi:hypothetical protein
MVSMRVIGRRVITSALEESANSFPNELLQSVGTRAPALLERTYGVYLEDVILRELNLAAHRIQAPDAAIREVEPEKDPRAIGCVNFFLIHPRPDRITITPARMNRG